MNIPSEETRAVSNKIKDDITPLEIEWRKLIVKHREDELVLRGKKFRYASNENYKSLYNTF